MASAANVFQVSVATLFPQIYRFVNTTTYSFLFSDKYYCDAISLVSFDYMYSLKRCHWSFNDVCSLRLDDGGRYRITSDDRESNPGWWGLELGVYDVLVIGE